MPTKHILKTNLYEKNVWREISPQKFFQTLFLPNIIPTEISTKQISRNILGQQVLKRHLYKKVSKHFPSQKIWKKPKNVWKDFLYPKNERNFLPQKPLKTIEDASLPFFGEKSLPNKFQKKFLPKNVWRTMSAKKVWRQISTKNISEEKSLQKIEDASAGQKGLSLWFSKRLVGGFNP